MLLIIPAFPAEKKTLVLFPHVKLEHNTAVGAVFSKPKSSQTIANSERFANSSHFGHRTDNSCAETFITVTLRKQKPEINQNICTASAYHISHIQEVDI